MREQNIQVLIRAFRRRCFFFNFGVECRSDYWIHGARCLCSSGGQIECCTYLLAGRPRKENMCSMRVKEVVCCVHSSSTCLSGRTAIGASPTNANHRLSKTHRLKLLFSSFCRFLGQALSYPHPPPNVFAPDKTNTSVPCPFRSAPSRNVCVISSLRIGNGVDRNYTLCANKMSGEGVSPRKGIELDDRWAW